MSAGEALAQDPGVVVRRTVMEEFNGLGCGYCPRGSVAMERLRADYPDTFIGISIHQFNDADPMYLTHYPSLGFESAPQCMLDRKVMTDPYYGGTYSTCYAIRSVFERYQQMETTVGVEVRGTWKSTARMQVVAEAELQFVADAKDYELVFVLTADSVSGSGTSWMQQNYYAKETAEAQDIPADDPLAAFCKGGSQGQSYTYMVYNDVAISCTYVNGVNKVAPLPSPIQAGQKVTGGYTLTLPSKTLLKNALNKDYIYVIALVIDADGHIANAARSRVCYEGESGITKVEADEPASPRYDLFGRAVLGADARGFSFGSGQKILLR